MMREGSGLRLITFVGNGRYLPTCYTLDGGEVHTAYVGAALAQFFSASEVCALATDVAWSTHGEAMTAEFERLGLPRIERVSIPDGQSPAEMWEQFKVLKGLLRSNGVPIVLDITHGFRSQPFFAAACVDFVRAVDECPSAVEIVYGAFEKDAGRSPIWRLTPFVELLDWTRGLTMFLRTGRLVGEVGEYLSPLGRAAAHQDADEAEARRRSKAFKDFHKRLTDFGDDLTTVRTGSLMLGSKGGVSSARSLVSAIDAVDPFLESSLPPLSDVVGLVRERAESLAVDSFEDADGLAALGRLARLYFELGRYAEAMAVVRETDVTRISPPTARNPGQEGFSNDDRGDADRVWSEDAATRDLGSLRNDIEHAGFRSTPAAARNMIKAIKREIGKLEERLGVTEEVLA